MSAPTRPAVRRQLNSAQEVAGGVQLSAARGGGESSAGAASGAPVDAALAAFFTDGARHVTTAEHRQLWSALGQAASGGKRLRPTLFHSLYLALGGRETAVAAEVGAALELLHTALVVHDDVIDGDTVRRGRPNVAGVFAADARDRGHDLGRATHYGQSAAILAGDLALAGAVRTIALCGARPATVSRMLDLLDRALHLSAAGELTDVRLSLGGAADIPTVISMEHQKTAVYSFELPLQLAAVLAGANADHQSALTRFARHLGVVYQIRDDLDGMFGHEAVTGKSTVSDLREGKCTPLIAYARSTSAWPRIHPFLVSGTADDAAAARVRLLLEECGARAYVEDLAETLSCQARESVAHLPEAALLDEWVRAVSRGTSEP